MSSLVLARKYRPRNFQQMVGQEAVVRALSNALQSGRLHHAYLFTGTRGIGKTTVSRILAKSLNCTGVDGLGGITATPCGVCSACTQIDADRFIDYIELDAASNRSIDEIRDLIERAAYKPAVGRFKVFMIDEAHQLTKDAFNALLKTLEEPPEYLKFVLATTDPEKMLPTVLSRCLQFNLRPMAPEVVREHLAHVLKAESVAFDEPALRLLARAARGSMRDALSLADQAIAHGAGTLQEAAVRQMLGTVDRGHAQTLVQALAQRDGVAVLAVVDALREAGLSAAGALDELALLLQQMAIEQAVPGALDELDPDHAAARQLAPVLAADETQLLYSIALQGRVELTLMSDDYAALTMVLLRLFAFPKVGAPVPAPRPLPLRTPAPPAMSVAVAPPALPPPPSATVVVAAEPTPAPFVAVPVPDTIALNDRWCALLKALDARGAVSGMVRELAWQAGAVACDEAGGGQSWQLVVESESLRADAQRDKLAAALSSELGAPVLLSLRAGVPDDSAARRDAQMRALRQSRAEEAIRSDPVVVELMAQFKGARLVPGSIKPVLNPEGSST
jgi:DNA polymerase III subunit gamma/tau